MSGKAQKMTDDEIIDLFLYGFEVLDIMREQAELLQSAFGEEHISVPARFTEQEQSISKSAGIFERYPM